MSAMAMATRVEDLTLSITEEIHVKAPMEVTFDSLLEQLGSSMETSSSQPMPMKIEPWPGGRWYRDLGDGNGHLWGHVQAIKRPDAARDLRAADDVVRGHFECSVPAERGSGRDAN